MRELMAQQHVSDIRSNASWRQGTKAALAGVSAAGHATSAAGSLTGGADLGMTKAIGTAAVSAAGTIRMGHGIRHRYKDAKRLARAKNYAEHDDSMGKRRMGKRGAGWAARQTTADLSKVGWSNLRTSRIAKALGAQGGTAREFRDRNEMRTLEEQGENIREQMVSNTADTKFKTRADDDMTASKAGAISDLATRRTVHRRPRRQ
jgi:hypothetical protein